MIRGCFCPKWGGGKRRPFPCLLIGKENRRGGEGGRDEGNENSG
jgi:hypothetical protein